MPQEGKSTETLNVKQLLEVKNLIRTRSPSYLVIQSDVDAISLFCLAIAPY